LKVFEKLKEKQSRRSVTGRGMPIPKPKAQAERWNLSKTPRPDPKTTKALQSKRDIYP
jgi:hypothetical protein